MAGRRKQRAKASRDPEFSREPHQRRFFGKATGVLLGVFVIVLAAAVIVPIAPEYQKLRAIEAEYINSMEEEVSLKRKRRQAELEAKALTANPEYLESRARDVGPYYRPGESVIKISE
ncbi:septum formation initiator family protein [bacterium]|nr:septum formation initiator family protein [bacterium]